MAALSFDILLVYGLILLAVFLFVNKRVPFDVASLILMGVLMVSGILTPSEGLSGFSNEATITIGCMFVLSEGLRRTGALKRVGDLFLKLGKIHYMGALIIIMGCIGVISAFINNTAAVAIFIPVIISLSKDLKVSPSKLLMPLSFAAMFGGVSTLIGTSTNLLVNSIAVENGMEGFSMFEFTPLGLIFFVAGFIYLFTIGLRLIPERRGEEDLTDSFEMQHFLTDLIIKPGSDLIGKRFKRNDLMPNLDLDIIDIYDEEGHSKADHHDTTFEEGDVLRIRGNVKEINRLLNREDLSIKHRDKWTDHELDKDNAQLVEAVVAPESSLVDQPIDEVNLHDEYGASLLAVRQKGNVQNEQLDEIRLNAGSSLLLYCAKDHIPKIESNPEFLIASAIELPNYNQSKIPVASGIILSVVLLAALGVMPIVVSAVCGVIAMILTNCLSNEEAWKSINWKVIFLLGGVLPLGIAMQKTGAAEVLVNTVILSFESLGPHAILSAFFFLSMMLTNIISNQATAALLAPIAIEASAQLGISAAPLLVAVTMAASLSFMTPIGYQTNTMIFGPGQYTFGDFLKVGTPLNILFWGLGTLFIPMIWPF